MKFKIEIRQRLFRKIMHEFTLIPTIHFTIMPKSYTECLPVVEITIVIFIIYFTLKFYRY